jgi:anthranilate phosphoribosyltransferase
MNPLSSALETLGAGRSLSSPETRGAVSMMLEGDASEAAIAAFLTALRIKGETADELEGAVCAVRERMTRWESGLFPESLLDTCGTGGDCANTVNISTAAAIVVAACRVPVVKHGNRAASGNSGSSDVLSVLGVATELEADDLRRSLAELRIAFLFAPRFHAGLHHLAPVRRQLPFRTMFNLVGPLCNPACPPYQLVGTPFEPQADLLAEVLARLAHIRRAVVVTGSDGLDEVTLDGPTSIRVIEPGSVKRNILWPGDFGLEAQSAATLKVSGALESAARLKRAFEGEKGPVRDYVLANSATALWTTGRLSIRDGMAMAASAIDSGAVTTLLERWKQFAPSPTTPIR